jgi:hypothetical protein
MNDPVAFSLSIVGTLVSVVGLVITILVWRWSRRISQDQDALARALAHLQVQEKNGVLRSNADWLSTGGADAPEYRLQCLVQDSLSVLRMLKYAPQDLLEA